MLRTCNICDYDLKDGDDVVAVMVAKFKYIPSDVNYAIEQPTRCIELMHMDCFAWDEHENDEAVGA